jgi:2-polyprenyl-3-methyl-5-hydroxy-6-metoxy-1,4-benzoquinol methylase
MKMNKTERFWDKQSIKFEKLVNKDEQSFIKIIENTRKYLKNSDKVLDFACGIGTSSINMINYVKEIQAIDISSGMIEVAKRRMKKLPIKNIYFIQTTLFDEQFKSESFDVITAFNILHLLEDPKIAIHRINELLKPGGIFISSTAFLGEKSLFRFIFYLISKIGMVPHLKLLKIDELKKIVISENFKITETQKSNHPTPSGFMVAKKV